MTTIYNISPGFLVTYMSYNGKKDISMEEVFKRLSLEMGGDGEKITKEQLDEYIEKAESGDIQVDEAKLDALTRIQENWDTISKGEDFIIYDNFKDNPTLLAATLAGNFTATEIEDSNSSMKDAIYDYLVDYLNLSDKEEISESDLTAYLDELIEDELLGASSSEELIKAVTNLITNTSLTSTIETEA